jgi:hypothetical protein
MSLTPPRRAFAPPGTRGPAFDRLPSASRCARFHDRASPPNRSFDRSRATFPCAECGRAYPDSLRTLSGCGPFSHCKNFSTSGVNPPHTKKSFSNSRCSSCWNSETFPSICLRRSRMPSGSVGISGRDVGSILISHTSSGMFPCPT